MRTSVPRFIVALPLLLAVAAVPAVRAQAQSDSQDAAATVPAAGDQEVPVFGAQSTAVQLDVVVRDKKGNLVKDLAPDDFEVSEDGQPQAVTGFTVVDAGPPPQGALAAEPPTSAPQPSLPAASQPEPAQQASPAVITFVFDRLTAEGRDRAYKATQDYVSKGHVDNDQVAVFALDESLEVIQTFTTDLDKIRRGFTRAAGRGSMLTADAGKELVQKEAQLRALEDSGASSPSDAVALEQLGMETRMLRQYDRLERDRAGYASANALMALIQGLKALPGRKTVVFFSEGLTIPSTVLSEFESVIATANRANVSVYAIDVGGLRTQSDTHQAAQELRETSAMRAGMERSGGSGSYQGSLTKDILERSEDMLRNNPNSGLGQLAEQTGGFLVSDTNDASKGFARIQEEMRFYYLLSYAPTNAAFDGTFRRIEVKLKRKGLKIQSRHGYLAVPPTTSLPVRTYEAPVVAELQRQPPPSDFPIHASALAFPEAARPGRVPVLVEFKMGAMELRHLAERKLEAADFAVVARIRDAQGKEVDRLSRDYKIGFPPDKVEQAKGSNVLFFQETDLPPGEYTVDAAAYDAVAQRGSVVSTHVTVTDPKAEGPRLSSIVLVKRADALTAEEAKQDNPLYFGETMLYPAVGEPFQKSVMPKLGFYFSAYSGEGEPPPARALIEILKDGRALMKTSAALSGADASGRIKHAGTLPLSTLEPGTYSLRVTVASGQHFVRNQAQFVVEP